MIASRLFIDGGVRVTFPEGGCRPVRRLVKQAEVPECPAARSSIRDRASSSVRHSTTGARSATRAFQDVGIPVADMDGSFLDSPFMPAASATSRMAWIVAS